MGKKVLIIDDEVDFCVLVKSYLIKKNCEVHISHTLTDGMGKFQTNSPDVVILDNNLPDGLGWPAAKNILAVAPGVNLFLISANTPGTKPIIEKDKYVDGTHYNLHVVEKPISITQIDNFLK